MNPNYKKEYAVIQTAPHCDEVITQASTELEARAIMNNDVLLYEGRAHVELVEWINETVARTRPVKGLTRYYKQGNEVPMIG